jgi:hypothetical protein
MKKLLLALAVMLVAVPALAVSPNVRIAQVYTGGGLTGTGTPYNRDYIVLFNNTGTDLNIGGWALLSATSTGNWGAAATTRYEIPANTWIAGCQYLLVVCGPNGSVGAVLSGDLATAAGTLPLNNSTRIGLFTTLAGNSNVACGAEAAGTLVDKVAWGTTNCAEGTALPNLVISGANRLGGGATDTDNNAADFAVVSNPVPMTSATPAQACAPVATDLQNWGALKSTFR